jgi:hypothetical protein
MLVKHLFIHCHLDVAIWRCESLASGTPLLSSSLLTLLYFTETRMKERSDFLPYISPYATLSH